MTEIFTLWVGKTNPICRLCMKSWQRLDYSIIVYTDLDDYDPFLDQFKLKDYKKILDCPIKEMLPFSDLFRFIRLFLEGGIWVDADMFLLRKLPPYEYIISSERTAQSGYYKREIQYIPNIGVLKFPPGCSLLKHVIEKIENSRIKTDKCNKNMFIFQDAILKTHTTWKEEVTDPEVYCPVNWANVKDLYYNDTFVSKYKQEVNQADWILENAVGVHLWENFSINKYKIDFNKILIYTI